MKLKKIIEYIDEKIPPELALDFDEIGFKKDYDLNTEIDSVVIFMDLLPKWDVFPKSTLIITHHPPLFIPNSPTYTIHSNWDIIDGGASDALCDFINLEFYDYFDDETRIGRICNCEYTFGELVEVLSNDFENIKIVSDLKEDYEIQKVGVISGFGLKNPDYIKLAKNKNLDVLISGDLTQETAILASFLDLTLIDLGHHESELPGLFRLADIFKSIDVKVYNIKTINTINNNCYKKKY